MTPQNQPTKAVDKAPAFVMSGDGFVVEWNKRAEALFGWTQTEAVGRKLSALLIPVHQRAAHEAGLKHFMQGGTKGTFLNRPLKIAMLHRDGHEFEVAIRIEPEKTASGLRFPTYVEG